MESNTIDPKYMSKRREESHSISRYGGPEMDSKADIAMHEKMKLRRFGMYGIPKFFVNGFAPDPWCHECGRRKVWCECVK